jgi:peptidase E
MMTQLEAITTAVNIGMTVTGLSADAVLFSPTFDGYLDMVCQKYNVQDEPEPEPEHDDEYYQNEMYDQLRRGEG